MRVILYCRVSSDEQAKGASLEVQESYLRSYCSNHGYEVVCVYKEDYSAKHHDLKRPEFKKMYDYCRKTKSLSTRFCSCVGIDFHEISNLP